MNQKPANRTRANLVVRGDIRATKAAEIMPGSPSYSFDAKGASAKASYYIAWDGANVNIPQAAKDFLGYSEKGTAGALFFVKRTIPYEHPNFKRYLYAESIPKIDDTNSVPVSSPSQDLAGVGRYDEANTQVVFTTRDYQILTDPELLAVTLGTFPDESTLQRYVSLQLKPSGRSERIPSLAALKWVGPPFSGGGLIGNPVGMANIAMIDLIEEDVAITWHQIPVGMVPWEAMDSCAGKTNAAPLGIRNQFQYAVFQTQTLIGLNPSISPAYPMVNGAMAVDIQYNFKHKPFGVNFFYRFQTGQYELATRDGVLAGGSLYKPANFDALFWGPNQIGVPFP